MMPSALVNQPMRKNSSMGFQFRTYSCSLDKKVIKMDPHLQNTLPCMSRSGERVHQRGCGNMEVVCLYTLCATKISPCHVLGL